MNIRDRSQVSASLKYWRNVENWNRPRWRAATKGSARRLRYFLRLKHAKYMVARREGQLAALNPKVAYPVDGVITDAWGYHGRAHDGVDLVCKPNAPIHAICDGVVIDVRSGGWWGKGAPSASVAAKGDGIIQIRCEVDTGPFRKGLVFAYGHAEGATVKVGERVKAGQRIGKAGLANAWHIHFMVHASALGTRGVGDRDPRPFLDYARKASR